MPNPDKHGIFPIEMRKSRHVSAELAKALSEMLDPKIRVLDIGCGDGYYIDWLTSLGFRGTGVDGLPWSDDMRVSRKNYLDADLSVALPLFWSDHSHQVISLEVGEHIPPEFAGIFLDNVTRPALSLILSWAIPGQGGFGHVNEQPNEWVIQGVEARGMKFLPGKTQTLRDAIHPDRCPWFRNTLMVFER